MFETLVRRLVFLKTYVLTEQNLRHMTEQGKDLVEMIADIITYGVKRGEEVSEILRDSIAMVRKIRNQTNSKPEGSRSLEHVQELHLHTAGVTELFDAMNTLADQEDGMKSEA